MPYNTTSCKIKNTLSDEWRYYYYYSTITITSTNSTITISTSTIVIHHSQKLLCFLAIEGEWYVEERRIEG